MSMDTALRDYLTEELALVESRKDDMDKKVKQVIARMNLELGKMEGISLSLQVRVNELREALGLKVVEDENESETTGG